MGFLKRGMMRKNDATLLKLVEEGTLEGLQVFFDMVDNGIVSKSPTVPTGVSINAKDEDGSTGVILAATSGNLDVLKLLMECNADINVANHVGYTALHMASWYGKSDVVEVLLNASARVNVTSNKGETPLHMAANYGKKFIIIKLMKEGADVTARNDKRECPLDLAVQFKHAECVTILIAAMRDRSDGTPLLEAIHTGNEEITQYLLDAGYNPNFRGKGGKTPLHEAAQFLRSGCAKLTLQYGGNPNIRDKEGKTAVNIVEENMAMVGPLKAKAQNTYEVFINHINDRNFCPKKPTNLFEEVQMFDSREKLRVSKEAAEHPLLVSRKSWTLNQKEWRSSATPGHSVFKAFDGDYASEWTMATGNNNFVILDLGSPYKLSGFRVVRWATPAAPKTIQLQIADDFEGPYETARTFEVINDGPTTNTVPGAPQDFFGFLVEAQFVKIVIVCNHEFLSTSVQQFQFYGMDTLFEDWLDQTGLQPFKKKFVELGYATYEDLCYLTTSEIEKIVPKELVVFTVECADFIRRDVMPVKRLWFESEPHNWTVEGEQMKPFVILGTPGSNDEIILHCHGNPKIAGTVQKRLTANTRGPSYAIFDDISMSPPGYYMFECQGVESPEVFARQSKPIVCVMGVKSAAEIAAAFGDDDDMLALM